MKMNVPAGIAVAVVGGILGFLAAVRMVPGNDAGEKHGSVSPQTMPGGGTADALRNPGDVISKEDKHSLAALEFRLRNKGGGLDHTGHMERLNAEELRSVMLELQKLLTTDPGTADEAILAIRAAARELYKREGVAALEWSSTLKRGEGNPHVFEQLVYAALEDSPALAKPWVDIYQEKFSFMGSNPFPAVALRAASAKGVDAVVEARRIFGDKAGWASLAAGVLPDDFDFKRLLQEFQGSPGLSEPMKLWAARSPDEAWSALKELDPGDGTLMSRYFNDLFNGMSQTLGEDAAGTWLFSRLGELPGEQRDRAIFSLLDSHEMRYEVVDKLMTSLPSDQDRITLAMGTVTPFAGDSPLGILRGLDPALQAEALVGAAKVYSNAASSPEHPSSTTINEYFKKVLEDLDLPPADRERVLETLHTPQAPFGR